MSHQTRYTPPHTLTEREYQDMLSKIRLSQTAQQRAEAAQRSLETRLATNERERQALEQRIQQANGSVTQLQRELSESEARHRREIEQQRKENEASQRDLKQRMEAEFQLVQQSIEQQRREFEDKLRENSRRVDERIRQIQQDIEQREHQQQQIAEALIAQIHADLDPLVASGLRVEALQPELYARVTRDLRTAEGLVVQAPQSAISTAIQTLHESAELRSMVEADERMWHTYQESIREQIASVEDEIHLLRELSFVSDELPEYDMDDRTGDELVNYWTHDGLSECEEEMETLRRSLNAHDASQRSVAQQQQLLQQAMELRRRLCSLREQTQEAVVRDSIRRQQQDRIEDALEEDGWHYVLEVPIGNHAENGTAILFETDSGLQLRVDIPHKPSDVISDVGGIGRFVPEEERERIRNGVSNTIRGALGVDSSGNPCGEPVVCECNPQYRVQEPSADTFSPDHIKARRRHIV